MAPKSRLRRGAPSTHPSRDASLSLRRSLSRLRYLGYYLPNPPVRTLLLLLMGPFVWALGYGAVPLAAFVGSFRVALGYFPDSDQRWIAFTIALSTTAVLLVVVALLFRVYDRMTANIRGDLSGSGPKRGLEIWACRTCGKPVTIHDVACRACGTLLTADIASRRPH